MTEGDKIWTLLTDELKKKSQSQFALGIQFEFYKLVKTPKGRFSYTLKSEVVKAMKSIAKDEISIGNKRAANYLIDTILNFQTRLVTNEHKYRKYKKKVSKLMDYLYEPCVESNVEPYVNNASRHQIQT